MRSTFTTSDGEAVVATRLKGPDFYQEVDCTVFNDQITYDTFTLDSTVDAITNAAGAAYIFTLYKTDGTFLASLGGIYSQIRVPATPTPTTLGAIALYSNTCPVVLPPTYYTADQVNALLAALVNMATKETEVIYGAGKLSCPADSAGSPINMGGNQLGVLLQKYGHDLAGYDAAIAAIGASELPLFITSPLSITADRTPPANVEIICLRGGYITVSSTKTFTISNWGSHSNRQYFFGAGYVVFAKNATPGGKFNLSWYAGVSNTADLSSIFTNSINTSLTNNVGGIVQIGPGTWKCYDWSIPSYTTVEGAGNGVSGVGGTRMLLANLSGTTGIAKITGLKRDIVVRGIAWDASISTTASAFLMSDTYPNTTSGIKLENCTFGGSGVGAPACCWLRDDALVWQCVNVTINHCVFQIPVNGIGFRSDTVNTTLTMSQPYCGIGAGGIGIDFLGIGTALIDGALFEGNAGYFTATAALNRTITTASITIGTKIVTINSGGAWNLNDVGQKIIMGAEPFNITGIANDGVTAYVEFNAAATHTAVSTAVYRYSPSASMAYSCFRFRGDRGNVTIRNSIDEAMAFFLVKNDQVLNPITIEDCFIQSIIQLNFDSVLNLRGNRFFSQQINTTGFGNCTINSFGDRCLNSGAYIYDSPPTTGVFLLKPTLTGVINNTTLVLNKLGFDKEQLFQEIQAPTRFNHVANWTNINPDLDHAMVEVGSAYATDPGLPSKPDIRWGRLNGYDGLMDLWYQVLRNYPDGACWFQGNQPGFKRYLFDAAQGFMGGLGVGGTVTQGSGSGKQTGVSLHKVTGQIVMNNAALAANTTVTFDLGNTEIDVGDLLILNHVSGGTFGAYFFGAQCVSDGAHISVRNTSSGSLSEAIVIGFELRKAVTT